MYADNTLTPKESVRLCALGMLAEGPVAYSQLAVSVRHFMDRVLGPSLDVLGTSIELLKYEGLAIVHDDKSADAIIEITEDGRAELKTLLTANIRAIESDQNTLIEALKFRYLHILDKPQQRTQIDLLIERTETELARLADLHDQFTESRGHLGEWLERQTGELKSRLEWLEQFSDKI